MTSVLTLAASLRRVGFLIATSTCVALSGSAYGQALDSFAVLAGTTITNTGPTSIDGNVGLSPGTAITGQADITLGLGSAFFQADAVALQMKSDLATTYSVLMNRPVDQALVGTELGGRTLTAGVYSFDTDAELNGTLFLQGGPSDVFIIQIPFRLDVASTATVEIAPGSTVNPANVFFVVGSSATLGTYSEFLGQIVALTTITLNTGAIIDCGAAWARNGAVNLDTNVIGRCTFTVEPGDIGDDLDEDDVTEDEDAIIDAINDYIAGDDDVPLGFQILDLLTPEELAALLDQIGGETATGVAPMATQAMNSFLTTVMSDHSGPGFMSAPMGGAPADRGTVSVMGYAPAAAPVAGGVFDAFDEAAVMPDISRWTVWASGFGGTSLTQGSEDMGTHDRLIQDYGGALGIDFHLNEDTTVGFSVSAGNAFFSLDDDMGFGSSQILQGAIYGRTEVEAAYIAGALAFGYLDVSTQRSVTLAGFDTFNADFAAQNFAGEVEVGYDLGWLTPYAALRGQALHTPAYEEVTTEGASTFALAYAENLAYSVRTEIGGTIDWDIETEGGSIGLEFGGAWVRDHFVANDMEAEFLALPGSPFVVSGATPSIDSLLLTAGAEMAFDNGFAIGGTVNGEFAQNAEAYSGSLTLSQTW